MTVATTGAFLFPTWHSARPAILSLTFSTIGVRGLGLESGLVSSLRIPFLFSFHISFSKI